MERYGLTRSLRVLNALQLAALLVHAARPLAAFVCADSGLAAVAASEG